RRHALRALSGFAGSLGAAGGGVARHVAEPRMPEQVVPVGMRGEPGDHRNAEPVHVIGELVEIGAVDAGIDQDQPTLPTHHDGVAPYPLALPDPDAVGHLIQHLMHSPIEMLLADAICGVVSPCGTSPARRTADSSTSDLFRSRNSSLPRGSLSLSR